jgi:hypothetical protein
MFTGIISHLVGRTERAYITLNVYANFAFSTDSWVQLKISLSEILSLTQYYEYILCGLRCKSFADAAKVGFPPVLPYLQFAASSFLGAHQPLAAT